MRKCLVPIILASAMILCGCSSQTSGTPVNTDMQAGMQSPGSTILSTPSASIIITPESTAKPKSTDTPAVTSAHSTINGDTVLLNTGIRVRDCADYFTMKHAELVKKLGPEFETIETGPEASYQGYNYAGLGMVFVFNETDYSLEEAPLMWIELDTEKLALSGVKQNMNYQQIQKILGSGEMKTTSYEEYEVKYYDLIYYVGNLKLVFDATSRDGADGWRLTIEKS